MPLKGEYSWGQRKDQIRVTIPLKGTAPSKVDIFGKHVHINHDNYIFITYFLWINLIVTETTLKVNYSPYIIDVVLDQKVNAVKHKAAVKEGNLNITLFKKDSGVAWDKFEAIGDKEQLKELKKDSLAAYDKLNENLQEERKSYKIKEERHATRSQMALDTAERSRLEDVKLEEKKAAEKEVYETFAKMQYQQQDIAEKDQKATKTSKSTRKKRVSFSDESKLFESKRKENSSSGKVDSKSIFDESVVLDIDDDDINEDLLTIIESGPKQVEPVATSTSYSEADDAIDDDANDEELDEDVKYLPEPRQISGSADGKVNIKFTPRVFPTPMRESKAAEEEDWVAKNRRHLKTHGVLGQKSEWH